MRIAKNSNLCSTSNRRVAPTELTTTNVLDSATAFPVTSKDRSSILFGHRLDNHLLQVLRIVGLFTVLIVVQDEWAYFLLKSLSNDHRAVFSFPVLLQRNQVVDSLVLEIFFIQLEYTTFLITIPFPSLQYRSDLPVQVRHTE